MTAPLRSGPAGPVNALGVPSPNRTDFSTWSRAGLEQFARHAADENLLLRTDLQTALAGWRAAVLASAGQAAADSLPTFQHRSALEISQ